MKMKKYGIWFLVGLTATIWLLLSLIPLYCAINFTCDPDAGSFWALFLQAVAVPVLLFELYRLRKTIQSTIWEPDINVGFAIAPVDTNTEFESKEIVWDTTSILNVIERMVENPEDFAFSSDWETSPAYFKEAFTPVRFTIRNKGKAVAKYLKIVLSLIDFPGDESPEIGSRDERMKKLIDGLTLVYRQDSNHVLFPSDFEIINLDIGSNRSEWKSAFNSVDFSMWYPSDIERKLAFLEGYYAILPKEGVYVWRATIWTEGSKTAISQDMSITVSKKGLTKLIESYQEQFDDAKEKSQRTSPQNKTSGRTKYVI
ncbi:MAG: hypothetical protein D6711_14555 [Chloroflexi bacterium]|nr:MAG: hypothetical protein D6711_14555 [Chloroflexota bacterium]